MNNDHARRPSAVSRRPDQTPPDKKPGEAAGTPPTANEDTFVVPGGKIRDDGPPKDPNAPSGSLSSDDAEAIAVDFTANPAHPKL